LPQANVVSLDTGAERLRQTLLRKTAAEVHIM
jgi:hypothetical protein